MRLNYFITPLVLYPLYAFSQNAEFTEGMIVSQESTPKNTIVRSLSNEAEMNYLNIQGRTIEHPTQVIRMSFPIENQQLDCAAVNKEIDAVFINKITRDRFSYTTYISCSYDPETHFATQLTIRSYFDPLSDEAIDYLRSYLAEFNGIDLLGAPFTIESASALIISMNISAGSKKNPNNPPFIEYREDRSNFYFKNTYDMRSKLLEDINDSFYSDDADKVLPFLDKWVFNSAGKIYKAILRDSNYVLLQPERIFLMSSGEELFVSPIKYYFANNCNKYQHHHCLKQEI